MAQSSTNNKRCKYMKYGFYSNPTFQFWRRTEEQGFYSQATKDRLNALVFQFENENKTVLNLHDNIK